MTFYGGTADQLQGWVNVKRGSLKDCENATITEKFKMKLLIQLEDPSMQPIFDRSKRGLYSGWEQRTTAFIEAARPHIKSGKAMGVFMGDGKIALLA